MTDIARAHIHGPVRPWSRTHTLRRRRRHEPKPRPAGGGDSGHGPIDGGDDDHRRRDDGDHTDRDRDLLLIVLGILSFGASILAARMLADPARRGGIPRIR